jgi:hypothetical protein
VVKDKMMDSLDLLHTHLLLFDEYRDTLESWDTADREEGCICGGRRPVMINAGTSAMGLDWDRWWRDDCPIHGYDEDDGW